MKKNGFTLIEITISITLLSVIMVFLFKYLNLVLKDETNITDKTKILLDQNIISKIINEDINNNGIKDVNCSSNSCDITLLNDETRLIEINENSVDYKDTTNNITLLKRKTILNYNITLKNDITNLYQIILASSDKKYRIEVTYYKTY